MAKKPGKEETAHWAYQYAPDACYLDWLTYQPSCVDGSFHQWQDGVGRNIACHVRQLNRGAGTGVKPPYSAIPMTQEQHLNEERYPIEQRIAWAELHLKRWVRTRYATEDDRDFRE